MRSAVNHDDNELLIGAGSELETVWAKVQLSEFTFFISPHIERLPALAQRGISNNKSK